MKIKQKIVAFLFVAVASLGVSAAALSPVQAQQKCGEVDTSIIGGDVCNGVNEKSGNAEDSAAWKILLLVLNIMTAGVGILAVGGIVYGAILYTTSSDSQEQTKKAKDVIRNVVIGILAYAGMYLLLNFLIPGGIFA
jgi:hypothetical protein